MLNKHKRVVKMVVYVDPQDYLKLKSKVALAGTNVSAWFREFVKEFVK